MNRQEKVAIAIMARDCEKSLKRNIPKIIKLTESFSDSKICVIENDSSDNTKSVLAEWANNYSNVQIISLDNIFDTNDRNGAGISRIERMVFYRNKYLDFFYSCKIDFDFLFVIDIDIDDFDVTTIISSIDEAPDNWNALFSNGCFYAKIFNHIINGRYYDSFAYLPYKSSVEDLIDEEFCINNDFLMKQLKQKEFVECDSAFAGIGIYKYKSLNNRMYLVEKNNRSLNHDIICEHIGFNRISPNSNSVNYIVKRMTVLYEQRSLIEVLFRKIVSYRIIIALKKIFRK